MLGRFFTQQEDDHNQTVAILSYGLWKGRFHSDLAVRSQVLRLILLDGLRPVFIGLIIGLAGGVAAGTLIRSILYGTSPLDPVVFTAMIGGLLLTAIIACVAPAIRASRIEPMQALRME